MMDAAAPGVLLLGDCTIDDRHASSVIGYVEHELVRRGANVTLALPHQRATAAERARHDGILVVSREKNRSYSGQIKTIIDEMDPDDFEGRPIGLISYSDAAAPASTAIDHLRVIVGAVRGFPIPSEACLSISEFRAASNALGESQMPMHFQPPDSVIASIGTLVNELLHYTRRIGSRDAYEGAVDAPRPAETGGGLDIAQPVDGNIRQEIAAAVAYIKENYADQSLCLDSVAGAVYMSRYHFSRQFREQTGRRFIDYVIMLRMTAARRLLLQTNLTVTTIATNVGYRDLSNFERSFKKYFETQPTQYRVRHSPQFRDEMGGPPTASHPDLRHIEATA